MRFDPGHKTHVFAAAVLVVLALLACKSSKSKPATTTAPSASLAVPSAPVDLSKLDANGIASAARGAGYPKAKTTSPGGGKNIGIVLHDVILGNPAEGAISLTELSSNPTSAYRIAPTRYITVHLEFGDPAETLLTALLKTAPLETITRKQIGAYLRTHGWKDIENLDDDLTAIIAEKEGANLAIDLHDVRGAVSTDASHVLSVATGEGKGADEKLMRAILAP